MAILGIYHNNATHISSAVAHDVQKYWVRLLPWPCVILCCEYDNHEFLQNYYRFQKYYLLFHQTLCFTHCDFGIWVVSDEYITTFFRNETLTTIRDFLCSLWLSHQLNLEQTYIRVLCWPKMLPTKIKLKLPFIPGNLGFWAMVSKGKSKKLKKPINWWVHRGVGSGGLLSYWIIVWPSTFLDQNTGEISPKNSIS